MSDNDNDPTNDRNSTFIALPTLDTLKPDDTSSDSGLEDDVESSTAPENVDLDNLVTESQTLPENTLPQNTTELNTVTSNVIELDNDDSETHLQLEDHIQPYHESNDTLLKPQIVSNTNSIDFDNNNNNENAIKNEILENTRQQLVKQHTEINAHRQDNMTMIENINISNNNSSDGSSTTDSEIENMIKYITLLFPP